MSEIQQEPQVEETYGGEILGEETPVEDTYGEKNVTNILVNGVNLYKTPSDVQVETEIIRNTERALDGTMCIDVVAKKLNLKISWDVLSDADYKQIKNQFPLESTLIIASSDKKLFSRKDYALGAQDGTEQFTCYVDSITALPTFIDDKLYWQSVTVTVAEV